MTVVDLVVAEPGWADEEFRRFIDQERWTGELELRRRDGSPVQVDLSATRVEIGSGPAIYLAAIRDLSDRKRLIEESAELVRAEAEAQAQAEAARERVRFVSDASELLAISLDYPATLVRLAELVVREMQEAVVEHDEVIAGSVHFGEGDDESGHSRRRGVSVPWPYPRGGDSFRLLEKSGAPLPLLHSTCSLHFASLTIG